MNQFSAHKILSFYTEAKSILAGKIPPPRMVSFWPTTVCNLNCDFCLFKRENAKQHMIADTHKTISFLDDIVKFGVKSFEMSGGGEPTIHPEFDVISREAFIRGLKVGLFTNGTKLDYETVKDFRYVRIGLDAVDAESYAAIKNPKSEEMFKTILDNICRLMNAKQQRKWPRVGIKFLINKLNSDQLERMVELAANLGANYVHFKLEHNGPNTLTKKNRDDCDEVLEGIRDKSKREIDILGSLRRRRFRTDGRAGVWCFLSPIHTVIDPTGNAFVCCYTRKKIGNVFDNRIQTFWGKKEHFKIIKDIDVKSCAKWDCRWKGYNHDMRKILIEDTVDIDFI